MNNTENDMTAQAQAVRKGFTYAVDEGYELDGPRTQTTFFFSESEARAYQATRKPGSSRYSI